MHHLYFFLITLKALVFYLENNKITSNIWLKKVLWSVAEKNLGKFRCFKKARTIAREIFSLIVVQGFFLKRKTRADTKSVLVSHR